MSTLFAVLIAAPASRALPAHGATVEEGRIAYIAAGSDGGSSLYTIDSDGSERELVVGARWEPYGPIWSPDGSKIAFVRLGEGRADLYVVNADGSRLLRLTSRRTDGAGQVVAELKAASWSPDSRKLAFGYGEVSDCCDSHTSIRVVSADGSIHRRLTSQRAYNTSPAWSPDGSSIAYHSQWRGSERIKAVGSEGDPHVLSKRASSGPTWSPDGGSIAFQRWNYEEHAHDLIAMDSSGGDKRKLTGGLPGWAPGWAPKWSPDGTRIAYLRESEGRYQIFTITPEGAGERQVTRDASDHLDFVWSPTGEHLAYGALGQIFVVSEDGMTTRPLTADPSEHAVLPHWQRRQPSP